MKLFLISQHVNNACDTYDCAVVAAKNAEDAQKMLPGWYLNDEFIPTNLDAWADSKDVFVQCIGTAAPGIKAGTVICASFNAG